jgi:hypothetical protein
MLDKFFIITTSSKMESALDTISNPWLYRLEISGLCDKYLISRRQNCGADKDPAELHCFYIWYNFIKILV